MVQDILLPVQPTEEDPEPADRSVDVYIPRLPELRAFAQRAPFITHEIVTGADGLEKDERGMKQFRSRALVRTVFCIYHEDGQKGAMALLHLMERLRIALLEQGVLAGEFELDLAEKLQTMVYQINPNQAATEPFYLGEMVSTWRLPPIQRMAPAYIVRGMPPMDPMAISKQIKNAKGSEDDGREDDSDSESVSG